MPKIESMLELQEQIEVPTTSLADVAQVYYDGNGDVYIRLHQGGDPGSNISFQVMDLLYGLVPWKVKVLLDGTQTIVMDATIFTCTPDETTVWSTTGGFPGQIVLIKVDNAAGVQISFSTGFTDVDAILVSDTGIQNRLLYYDGSTWREFVIDLGIFIKSTTYAPAYPNMAIDYISSDISSELVVDDSAGNMYEFVTSVNNRYVIFRVNFTLPVDFKAWSSNAIGVDIKTYDEDDSYNSVELEVIKSEPYTYDHDHVFTVSNLTTGVDVEQAIISSSDLATGGATWSPGDLLQLSIRADIDATYYVDIGRITFYYES